MLSRSNLPMLAGRAILERSPVSPRMLCTMRSCRAGKAPQVAGQVPTVATMKIISAGGQREACSHCSCICISRAAQCLGHPAYDRDHVQLQLLLHRAAGRHPRQPPTAASMICKDVSRRSLPARPCRFLSSIAVKEGILSNVGKAPASSPTAPLILNSRQPGTERVPSDALP